MKILIAPNAFKESLTAHEAAAAIARGLRRAIPRVRLTLMPVADGGDGTVEVLRRACGGRVTFHKVTGPLGAPVRAPLIQLGGRGPKSFVIEMAKTSGLALVPPARRNPMKTTTRGLGEMIAIARDRGARRIIMSLGGSATVDGGIGMAQALGFRLLDSRGREIASSGDGLTKLKTIVPPEGAANEFPEIIAACDVNNPLLGPRGAAAVFGPQKGATPAMIPKLEAGLKNLAQLLAQSLPARAGRRLHLIPGSGAAGGVGAGLVGFLGARIEPGAEFILDTIGFDRALAACDLVITGEGRLDRQSLHGKAPAAVGRRAARAGKPCIALAGSVEPELASSARHLNDGGWIACYSIVPGPMALNDALALAEQNIENVAHQIGRTIRAM